MNDFKTKPNVGIIGCMLLYPQTGGIQCCGITFQDNVGRHLYLNSRPEKIYLDTFQDVQCTIFAFCAIRYCAIKKAGYLNEDFYNGYEDWDYQMRIKQFGYSAIIDTKSYNIIGKKVMDHIGILIEKEISPDFGAFIIQIFKMT